MEQIKEKIRAVTFLTREQIDFLDKLGKDNLFYHGFKFSRAKILSELVDLLMQMEVNLKKIDLCRESLTEGLLKLIDSARSRSELNYARAQEIKQDIKDEQKISL